MPSVVSIGAFQPWQQCPVVNASGALCSPLATPTSRQKNAEQWAPGLSTSGFRTAKAPPCWRLVSIVMQHTQLTPHKIPTRQRTQGCRCCLSFPPGGALWTLKMVECWLHHNDTETKYHSQHVARKTIKVKERHLCHHDTKMKDHSQCSAQDTIKAAPHGGSAWPPGRAAPAAVPRAWSHPLRASCNM